MPIKEGGFLASEHGVPADGAGGDAPGPRWDDAAPAASVVRSEERARVVFPIKVRGRVRLVKHVVTEEITHTFTVRREELRVEEEPPGAADPELSWAAQIGDDTGTEFEIVLHAEQVVASTQVVPVERVRVRTRVVETAAVVSAEVWSEHVELHPIDVEPVEEAT